ncbi:MAG TPA: heme exporter protein CcmD [Gammaproteobacteria bacterium]|nr:heme exporter protein CcmD [Gammaproteobacteria bacterium]
MKSLHEFLTMGGYAIYVWPAYIIAAVVMIVNLMLPAGRLKRLKAEIRRRRSINP